MIIKASDLIEKVRQAYAEKWGYIYGTRGQVWTQAQQDKATREMTVKYGQQWVGRKVADCSGLLVWAVKALGGSIYHGSNTMWNSYTDPDNRGAVGGSMTIAPGCAVFQNTDGRRTHVGLYVGGGKCIEAQGTRTGVVESNLDAWDEWGELLVKIDGKLVKVELDLPYEAVEIAPRTLRKGDSGSDVKELQEALIAAGHDVGKAGADGIFGSSTLSAVKKFQKEHGLDADGIVGAKTRAALKVDTEDDEPVEDKPQDAPEAPQEPEEGWDGLSLEEKVEDLNERLKRQEGGG